MGAILKVTTNSAFSQTFDFFDDAGQAIVAITGYTVTSHFVRLPDWYPPGAAIDGWDAFDVTLSEGTSAAFANGVMTTPAVPATITLSLDANTTASLTPNVYWFNTIASYANGAFFTIPTGGSVVVAGTDLSLTSGQDFSLTIPLASNVVSANAVYSYSCTGLFTKSPVPGIYGQSYPFQVEVDNSVNAISNASVTMSLTAAVTANLWSDQGLWRLTTVGEDGSSAQIAFGRFVVGT